ncbi:hybrid sensor histidine kinase/response regulator [Desulfotalea psychrophila]|nr:ATP-binding protein [Desulfotalea psychrophila]
MEKVNCVFSESNSQLQAIVNGFSGMLIYVNKKLEVIWSSRGGVFLAADGKGANCCDLLRINTEHCVGCSVAKTIVDASVEVGVSAGLLRGEGGEDEDVIFEITSSPVQEKGHVVGAMLLVNNITERFHLEKRLRQTQKMEAIGTLAGGVAHDFNNVLTPILGYSEIIRLRMEQEGLLDSAMDGYLGEILSAAGRAQKLVEQILTFSCSAEQKISLQYGQPVIKEVSRLMRTMLPATIKINLDLDEDCGRISIDPVHLQQIIVNLCTNSGHAMEGRHGTLTISLVSEERDEGGEEWLEIIVADTGCGIEDVLLERIFEPYFTTREKEQGTGMGLAVVHGLVHSYGGRLRVESEIGCGTSFHVSFPVSEKAVLVEQVVSLSELQCGSADILLVDDDEQVVDVSAALLERLGYRVLPLTSARKALVLFLQDPSRFDLLITDLTMPDLTGVELCGEVRKVRPDLPVVLCTGYSEKISEAALGKVGINHCCLKPVSFKELARVVATVLAKGEFLL